MEYRNPHVAQALALKLDTRNVVQTTFALAFLEKNATVIMHATGLVIAVKILMKFVRQHLVRYFT